MPTAGAVSYLYFSKQLNFDKIDNKTIISDNTNINTNLPIDGSSGQVNNPYPTIPVTHQNQISDHAGHYLPTIQRSIKGTWSGPEIYKVELGDGLNGSTPPGKNIIAWTYTTPMFIYHVDLEGYAYRGVDIAGNDGKGDSIKVTKKDVEDVAALFESNVNYGLGAYIKAIKDSEGHNKYIRVDKPEIELISGHGGISWGGHAGAEITLSKEKLTKPNLPRDWWIKSTSALMLHEYGHHETMMATTILSGRSERSFDEFKNHIKEKFITYWSGADSAITGNNFGLTSKPYPTPYGVTMPAKYPMYAKPEYNWKATEFVTRVEQLIESNYNFEDFIGFGTASVGDQDLAGLYDTFDGDSPIESNNISQTIDAYKKYIYGFNRLVSHSEEVIRNKITKSDFSDIVLAVASDVEHVANSVTTKYNFSTSGHYSINDDVRRALVDLIGSDADSLHTYKDIVDYIYDHPNTFISTNSIEAKPAQYRFNSIFNNDVPEEIVNAWVLFKREDSKSRKLEKLFDTIDSYSINTILKENVYKKGGHKINFDEFNY